MLKKYEVLSPIKTIGGIVVEGSIELDDKDAAELKALGAIGGLVAIEVIPTKPALSDEQKLDAVKAAIGTLDAANTDVWTAAGKPNAAALTAIVGFDVSAALRDAAWDLVKPAA